MINQKKLLKLIIAANDKCEGGNETVGGSEYCETEKCQSCCPHSEWDHDQCMDCEKERCPGEAIDRAMDRIDMER